MIYAIRNTRSGSIKFGFSKDPLGRRDSLQTANEDLLACEGFAHAKKRHEKMVHRFLESERIRGEWYRGPLSEALAEALHMIRVRARDKDEWSWHQAASHFLFLSRGFDWFGNSMDGKFSGIKTLLVQLGGR